MLDENISTVQKIQSELYGEITIEPHQVYQFPQGLVGLSYLNQFALLPYDDTDLFVLQSFQDEVSLLLVPTSLCANGASFKIDESTVTQLGVTENSEVITFFVLRFIEDKPFINVKAPILVVPSTQKGCQYVIQDDALSIREPLVFVGEDTC
ncbi:flagellar assembly protein FliW [Paenibacillus sp. GXUN7292]|uniref:flagellar assembly protein FliW n=1 Tax=Paenibacillus sp. GXUN7292 TaxID=3422499 RepID=UPI003D7EBE6D